jgi:hypothetical protein
MPVPKLAIDKKETEQDKSTRIGQSYKGIQGRADAR